MKSKPINLSYIEGESMIAEPKVYNADQAIERAGGFGRYQWMYVPMSGIGFIVNGIFVSNLSYLTLIPVMKCPTEQGEVVCKDYHISIGEDGKLKPGVYPDFSYERSLHNWITKMDMYGSQPFETSLFGSLFFCGILLSMTILMFTSKYGRRINLQVSVWVTFFVVILLTFVNNLYARYIGMFLLGGTMIRNISCYILATELSPYRVQIIVATGILGIDACSITAASLYFKFIGDEWNNVAYAACIIALGVAIGSLFLPESPRFLYEKGEVNRARAIINAMARRNKSSMIEEIWIFEIENETRIGLLKKPDGDDPQEVQDYNEARNFLNQTSSNSTSGTKLGESKLKRIDSVLSEQEIEDKTNPLVLMRNNPKVILNLMIVVMSWVAGSFNYFLLNFDIKNLGGNIFINSSLITIAGITGKILIIFARRYFSTKACMIMSYSLLLIFGIGLVFFDSGLITSICIAFIEIGIGGAFTLSYFINSEYFPPLFLGFSFAVSQFIARGVTIFSYFLANLSAPVPMILLGATTTCSLLSLIFLTKPNAR